MKTVTFIPFLLVGIAFPQLMDKPEIEWARLYSDVTEILDADEANNGFILGSPDALFFTNSAGDRQWLVSPADAGWHYLKFQSVFPLPCEGYVSTGVGKETESSSYSIFLIKVDLDGNVVWIRNYDNPETTDYAFDVIELPDEGFAIAARQGGEAWVFRTDSQGDTLWTSKWGWTTNAKAMSILYIDDGLTVFAQGNTPTTPSGPHLIRYDMEGNLLWETNFPDWPGSSPGAQAMCEASDGGLLLLDHYWPAIMHTDYQGNPDWWTWPPGVDQPYGYSVSTTMDGGILYGGELRPIDSRAYGGVIARFDSLGNDLWYDNINESSCCGIYSATQLSQGGYIAAGIAFPLPSPNPSQGFLIKYAPELGFEPQEGSSSVTISSISPNPFSAVTEIQFSLVEAGEASLTVFDLYGRVVDVLGDGLFSEGEHTLQWAPEGIASGCYMLRLSTSDECVTGNLVFLR